MTIAPVRTSSREQHPPGPAPGRLDRDGRSDRAWAIAGVGGFLASCAALRAFVTDDAWITARYAENLAAGRGLVWNPGGPPTEGYSNPLLVAVEAAGVLAGLAAIDVARALGVLCGVALVLVLGSEGGRVVGPVAARVAMLLTALFPPIALWAVGGLETLPVALALAVGLLALCRDPADRAARVRAAVAFALLPWLRPEGLLVALAVALAADGAGLLGARRRAAAARLAVVAAAAIASQAALELVRLAAFGHLLPNSVLFKAGTGGTFEAAAAFAAPAAPVLALAALGLWAVRGRQWLLVVPPAVYLIGSLGMRDSVNAFGRLLLPAWPAWALLAGLAIAAAHDRLGARGRTPAIAAGALAALFAVFWVGGMRAVAGYGDRYVRCKQAAREAAAGWLRSRTPPTAAFSISDAGLVPARAGGRPAVDQLLLNDPRIQETGPLPVGPRVEDLYARPPEVMILASRDPDRFAGIYPVDGAIRHDRRAGSYRLATVAGSAGCAYHLFIYRRTASGRLPGGGAG